MYRSIMAPLDGSAFGEHALPLALGIARRACAMLHLVHVQVLGAPTSSLADQAKITAEQERMVCYLHDLAAYLSDRWEILIKPIILDGPVADTLHTYAQEHAIDLTVMSTHGYGALSRIWLGNIANAFIRRLTTPILLIRPHGEIVDLLETIHEQAFEHMLLPLDGSMLSEAILEPAMSLGTLMGAKYTLLRAIEPLMKDYMPATYATRIDGELLNIWRVETQVYLEQVAERVRISEREITTVVPIAHAAEAILDYIPKHAVDLVALTTHGRSGLANVLMGSVADVIVNRTPVPVLLYRPVQQPENAKTTTGYTIGAAV